MVAPMKDDRARGFACRPRGRHISEADRDLIRRFGDALSQPTDEQVIDALRELDKEARDNAADT